MFRTTLRDLFLVASSIVRICDMKRCLPYVTLPVIEILMTGLFDAEISKAVRHKLTLQCASCARYRCQNTFVLQYISVRTRLFCKISVPKHALSDKYECQNTLVVQYISTRTRLFCKMSVPENAYCARYRYQTRLLCNTSVAEHACSVRYQCQNTLCLINMSAKTRLLCYTCTSVPEHACSARYQTLNRHELWNFKASISCCWELQVWVLFVFGDLNTRTRLYIDIVMSGYILKDNTSGTTALNTGGF